MNISLHGLLAALSARVPVVATHQSCYEANGLRSFVLENMKRYAMHFVTNVSCSSYVANQFKAKSIAIPNAYDDTLFVQPASPNERDYDFVFCGRLVSDKGADVCVHAFADVLKEIPDASLTVVGTGPEQKPLEAFAENLGVSGNVRFTGALRGAELVGELQKHACMVVPSLWEEPFGIVALEGVACCDTVIVSLRGGLPEAVGDCGLVVEPSVREMAAAMLAVANARRQGSRLPGQPTHETRKVHLARHTPEFVARQYLAVLERALAR
jgi:glycosyltransferase involved in cell wall biosynthesis